MAKAAKYLVIVESPAKAKTINKYLGSDYIVLASMGHIRDLPQKRFGIDLEHNFEPQYVTLASKKSVIDDLKKAAKTAERVYLAPDMDREGEAIAWHLVEALKIPQEKVYRVTFNQITKQAIQDAFKQPGKIKMDKVFAQQARRILDRIVGYKLSPLLWKKVTKGLSAGRVQSVAVRLIAEREKEIRAFVPQEYWCVAAQLQAPKHDKPITAEMKKLAGATVDEEPYCIKTGAEADAVVARLRGELFTVSKVDTKVREDKPEAPFITSTLQQQASIHLRFSSKKTMLLAQQLYEGLEIGADGQVGLITYMRTDSTQIAPDAVTEAREYIRGQFKPEYLPAAAQTYVNKNKSAQEAHECVRPTSAMRTPTALKDYLSQDQWKLYKLIWERFVASQMSPARVEITTVEIAAADALFRASGRRVLFDGYRKVWMKREENEDQMLPALDVGMKLALQELNPTQHFTQPPPRYTEASLIRTLEKEGIGRPSTYATIISTIQDRGYVRQEDRKFICSDLGILITDKLVGHFPSIMDTEFTSRMENELDEIEDAKIDWHRVLTDFYAPFSTNLQQAMEGMSSEKDERSVTEHVCELCGKPMVKRWSRRGQFLGCSGYPDCKNIKALGSDGAIVVPPKTDEKCPACGEAMVVRTGRTGQFLACSKYPDCKTTKSIISPDQQVQAVEFNCKKCARPMVVKYSRRGPFYACSGYPECKSTVAMDPTGKPIEMETVDEKCDKCGADMAVKWSRFRKSKFLACTAYPKCKNTKPYAGAKAGGEKEGETAAAPATEG